MSKNKIKNAHCTYYEGQTGLCKAKEFVKCNPVNCKLYTIDELSTILDLQEQLKRKEQECEELKQWKEDAENLFKTQTDNADKIINRHKQTLDEIEKYTIKQFCDNCEDMCSTEYSSHCEYCEYQEYFELINKAKDG